eukprot:CAMPEP_0201919114 /NCGR_PEP_ID=MMETSP0903-20130614/8100_1 /ASSEMBLY_ACC=CAM_ASM_000552 /TAXON_ID=420261 /ORGANISM="Thalassiosira antarctica, Strain CCMP982" /LENGTH=50 /DNA_ID=CAMNT_0048455575 /DNA_START=116 /DNA_END=264 /DNA_ORIENTATION=+
MISISIKGQCSIVHVQKETNSIRLVESIIPQETIFVLLSSGEKNVTEEAP